MQLISSCHMNKFGLNMRNMTLNNHLTWTTHRLYHGTSHQIAIQQQETCATTRHHQQTPLPAAPALLCRWSVPVFSSGPCVSSGRRPEHKNVVINCRSPNLRTTWWCQSQQKQHVDSRLVRICCSYNLYWSSQRQKDLCRFWILIYNKHQRAIL